VSYFKAKMHLFGASPKTPQWELRGLQHSPDSVAGFKGPTSEGRGGTSGGKGKGGEEWRGPNSKAKGEVGGKGGRLAPQNFAHA